MKRTPISIGDVIRAVKELEPGDDETRDAIRRLLGIQAPKVVPAQPTAGAWKPTSKWSGATVERGSNPAVMDDPAPPPEAVDHPEYRRSVPRKADPGTGRTVLRRLKTGASAPLDSRAASWITDAEPVGPASLKRPAPPPDPLFRAPRDRAILTALLTTHVPEGPFDFDALIERIAGGRPLGRIPRVSTSTLRRGVQLLVDRGPGMDPFQYDQQGLISSLDAILREEHLETQYFLGCPSRGVGRGPRSTWHSWQPPPLGRPVLAITDLGLGGPALDRDRAFPDEWLVFANTVHDAGSMLLALVPYNVRRWPARLARALTFIHWSERTTVGEVRRAIRHAYERIR